MTPDKPPEMSEPPTLPPGYTLRRPTRADAQAVLELMIAYDIAAYGTPDSDLEDLLDQWDDIDLAQDAWLAYAPDGRLAAYAAVLKDQYGFFFQFVTHPELDMRGLSAFCLAQCEQRACQIAAADPAKDALASTVVAVVIQGEVAAVEAAGFEIHTYHLRMHIDLEAPPPPVTWPEGLRLRNVVPGRDDWDVYNLIMTAFQKPGRIAPSFESWQGFMMREDHFIPELWYLVHAGDGLVGAALCFDYDPLGWVRQLGVAEAWRRQGIASALLQHVFGEFYRRGRRQVALGVEADNASAYAFYEKIGMRRVRQYNRYRKRLR